MTFNLLGFESIHVMGTPSGDAGSRNALHSYVTSDAPSVVETADYFLSIYRRLKPADILLVSYNTTPKRTRTYIVSASAVGGVTILREEDDDVAGQAARAIVATADGLTTGLILDSDSMVDATNGGDVNNIITLPLATAATRNREIVIYCNTANCELRTPAASNQTINNVDSDGSQEALLTAGNTYVVRQHLANGWLLQGFTNLGAVQTPVVPD